ncbi:MAG: AEC family transporter [Alphaproteobacteria bacterium]|jgi:predicted permease|nr:AEC family transporter [Candidatus Jidaibacter sp.]
MYEVFTSLLNKIYPFYALILAGWVLGKYFAVNNKSTVNVLFYLIVPVVFFEAGYTIKIEVQYLLLPLILLVISVIMNRAFLYIGHKIWETGAKPAVIAFAAGTANTGYFGLPVAMMLFDEQTVAVYMLMNIGLAFYDYTLGAFTFARAKFSQKKAFISVLKIPIMYAFSLGFIVHHLGINIPDNVDKFFDYFRGSYVILGTILLGLSLSTMPYFRLDLKLIATLLASRFIIAPIITLAIIYIDANYSMLFGRDIHLAMLLTSIMPPAINTVVFATMHHAHPEEASTAVLSGTIIGIIYLPLMVALIF